MVNLRKDKSLLFQGTIETDGVGVSVLKQSATTNKKAPVPKADEKNEEYVVPKYIESLNPTDLAMTMEKCVLIDPGRRDLLFRLKETSNLGRKQVMRYIKVTKSKLSRRFKILQKKSMPAPVKAAQERLSETKSFSVNLEEYKDY